MTTVATLRILKSTWLLFRNNHVQNGIKYARFQTSFIDAATGKEERNGYGLMTGFDVWLEPVSIPIDMLDKGGVHYQYDQADFYIAIKEADGEARIAMAFGLFKEAPAIRLIQDFRLKLLREGRITDEELQQLYSEFDRYIPGAAELAMETAPR